MDVDSVCMHNCVRLGGSGGMHPQEILHALRLLPYVAHGKMSIIYPLQMVGLSNVCRPKGGFE